MFVPIVIIVGATYQKTTWRIINVVFRQDLLLNVDRITQSVTDFIRGNPIVSTAAVGIGTTGILATASTLVKRKKKTTRKRKKKSTRKRKKATRKRKSCRPKKKRKYGLRKSVRSKKIRKTKNGQPYIILANGRARFIKKSSARSARKRKGGFS